MDKYRISSNRLGGYDYTSGYFFVTICTKDREHYFGEIVDGEMILNEIGQVAYQNRQDIPKYCPNIQIDEFIVMPNHIHGIVVLKNTGQQQFHTNTFGPQSHNLGSMVRGFKSSVKKYATIHNMVFYRQSNYYDHIIMDEKTLYNIQQYIQSNPQKRYRDRNNSVHRCQS